MTGDRTHINHVCSLDAPKAHYSIDIDEEDERYAVLTIVDNLNVHTTEDGLREYDYDVYCLPGILLYDGLEENIHANHLAWLAHARAFTLEKEKIHNAIDALIHTILLKE